MIQPGQKLKEGDYTRCNSIQANELSQIEKSGYFNECPMFGVVYDGEILMPYDISWCVELEEYNFSDFKQLCENTFGDEKV